MYGEVKTLPEIVANYFEMENMVEGLAGHYIERIKIISV